MQLALGEVRDRRLARARQARQPDDARMLALGGSSRLLVDVELLPADVVRPAQREMEQPGTDRAEGHPVDEDEAARLPALGVGIEGDRLGELDRADADLVHLELVRCDVLERVDVQLVLERRDRRGDGLGSGAHQVRAAAQHRLLAHPEDHRLELVGDLGRLLDAREQVAAAHVDLARRASPSPPARRPRARGRRRTSRSTRRSSRGRTDRHGSRSPGLTSPPTIVPRSRGSRNPAGSPTAPAGGTAVRASAPSSTSTPRGTRAASGLRTTASRRLAHDVVAAQPGDRDADDVLEPELVGDRQVVALDAAERRLE